MADLYRVRDVTAETKVYGILGRDVLRSLSPVLHNRAFEARGLDAVYVPLQAEALAPFIEALPALGLSGFSVTQPYKVEILPYLQEVEEPAALCGSVNTVVVHDGTLRGSTTDGTGVLAPLKKKIDVKGRNVVILGAGGAARSAALALIRKGAHVTLLARDADKAEEVGDRPRLRARALCTRPRCTRGTSSSTRRPWDRATRSERDAAARGAASRGRGRAGHDLRPAGDALPARGAGGGRQDHRRPPDAAGPGRRPVRDLDGRWRRPSTS